MGCNKEEKTLIKGRGARMDGREGRRKCEPVKEKEEGRSSKIGT